MSTTRNRGKEGRDDLLFGTDAQLSKIKEAIIDMSYLLSRGFAEKSTLALVGNRYKLNARQQRAIQGMSAANIQIDKRKSTHLCVHQLNNKTIAIDGFNLLIV